LAAIAVWRKTSTSFSYKHFRPAHPLRHRILSVVFLTLVFTPSILPDWLCIIPVPAAFGLIVVAPDLLFRGLPFSDTPGIVLLFIYPLLFGFAIFYTALFLRDWYRARRSKHDPVAVGAGRSAVTVHTARKAWFMLFSLGRYAHVTRTNK
jgi:hypothetical protein